MRQRRRRLGLFWPIIAAFAVIGIIVASQNMQPPGGRGISGVQEISKAYPALLPEWLRPKPLVASSLPQKPDSSARRVPTARRENRAEVLPGTPSKSALVSSLTSPPAASGDGDRMLLRAPVRDPREELAGLLRETLLALPHDELVAVVHSTLPVDDRRELAELGELPIHDAVPMFSSRPSVPTRLASVRTSLLPPAPAERDADRSKGEAQLQPAFDPAELAPRGERAAEIRTFPDHSTLKITIGTPTPHESPAEHDQTQPTDVPQSSSPSEEEDRTVAIGVAWPLTPRLEKDLQLVEADSNLAGWVQSVRHELLRLQSLTTLAAPQAGESIERLMQLGNEALQYGETLANDRNHGQRILRTAHAVLRRTVVWRAVWKVATEGSGERPLLQTVSMRQTFLVDIKSLLDSLGTAVEQTGDPEGWRAYLLLDEVAQAAASSDAAERKLLAQRLMSRAQWAGLDEAQRAWVDRPELHQLLAAIRPWSEGPVDYVALLSHLERLESDATDLGSIQVANAVQDLRFSDNRAVVAIARAVNDHYRNANIRLAVAARLLEQLLPEVQQRTMPIEQRLVGVPVRGTGVVDTELKLHLIPTQGAWTFQLQTLGSIRSKTGSEQWPARFSNQALSTFDATTPIVINRDGFELQQTEAAVESEAQLRSLETSFDGLPLISSLVRSIAMAQYNERKGLAKKQSEKLVKAQIESSVNEEMNREVNKVASELSSHLIGPLGNLKLDPLVVDLDTSATRLTARYRIAGDWQVAANTPRPRALARSLLSVQVHQSAINNMLEQLVGGNDLEPIDELFSRIAENFGVRPEEMRAELPSDVKIRFTSTRPITIEIEDNSVWLTFRILRLKKERGVDLTRFTVRVQYLPVLDGMHTHLRRSGILFIDGPSMSMRERLPVRAIFNKVLNPERTMPLIAQRLAEHRVGESLTVGLLEMTDGWIGLSICEKVASLLPGETPTNLERDRFAEKTDDDAARSYNR